MRHNRGSSGSMRLVYAAALVLNAHAAAVLGAVPPHPLSFQQGHPAAFSPRPAEGASGVVFDNTYQVPPPKGPDIQPAQYAADLGSTQRAIEAIAADLNLTWRLRREVFGVEGEGGLLAGTPVLLRSETTPIAVLPAPANLIPSLSGTRRWPRDGVFFEPASIRPDLPAGLPYGTTMFIARTPGPWVSDSLTPRMQGVPREALPEISPRGVNPYHIRGRVVDRLGLLAAHHLRLDDEIIGGASTAMVTRSIWYFKINIANPHGQPRARRRIGPLEDATVIKDWCFPIMDGNGQARPAEDPRKAERSSPYENLVTTSLIEFPFKHQQAPVVLPTAFEIPRDTMGEPHRAALAAYDRTETIVLPQRLIEAARGVVIVRKASSWRPMAPDIIIDSDSTNPKDILGVYISQIVEDDRLIDALCDLCGAPRPAGERRAALIERVSTIRDSF
ncbi:MAG: hypothetical protein IBJ11_10455 [Phycisphaerales bacterium]|nr:hypothetical protein [Phycisphaerales bacterium]